MRRVWMSTRPCKLFADREAKGKKRNGDHREAKDP
jgi:hypothetical protein